MAAPEVVPWPEEFVRRYVGAGYWAGRPLGELLGEAAARTPDAPALVDGDVRLTHAGLLARADATAARLAGLGLAPGDRIVVQLANTAAFVVLAVACLRSGIVPVMA
ncbi:2,3-dihydroxybenzoate-AMP ligase, partial [Corallococcus praedator]